MPNPNQAHAPQFRPTESEPRPNQHDESSDLTHGLTAQDQREAFEKDRQKTTDKVPNLTIDGTEPKAAGAKAAAGDRNADGADKKAEAAPRLEDLPKLNDDDKKRVGYLQETLSNMAPVFSLAADGKHVDTAEVERMRNALDAEKKAGVFGPATRAAYAKYADYLNTTVLLEMKELDMLEVALPPGCPLKLAADRYQRAMDPEVQKALNGIGKEKLDLGLDTAKVPGDEQLDKLDDTIAWLTKCHKRAEDTRAQFQERVLNESIEHYHLPEGWKKKPGDDDAAWRASAQEMIDLTVRCRNYVDAMQHLYKSARYDDFPIDLPQGSSITVDVGGERHQVKASEIKDYQAKSWLKEGKIVNIHFDLPKDLRQEDPQNAEKIAGMRDWLNRNGDRIDQAVKSMLKLDQNPQAVVKYGDVEIANGKGLFNGKDEFLGIVNAHRYQPKQGETMKDVNLVGYNFDVEQITEGKDKGKYRVTQTIKAEEAPVWAYLNIRALGIKQVGKEMPTETKILNADDFVPVQTGDKIELVKAKDLQYYKNVQRAWYYGEKGLIATMDAALLVSGGVEFSAAARGAMLAKTGAEAAFRLSGKEAATQLIKSGVKVGVAGLGVFNNAGARATSWGENVNLARGLYFMGDMSVGALSWGWRAARGARAAEGVLTGADKVESLIHGSKIVNGEQALKGIPFVRQVHTGASYAFKATEAGFVLPVAYDFRHAYGRLAHPGRRNEAEDATIVIGDGRGLQAAGKNSFDMHDKLVLNGAREQLDNYSNAMQDGRSQAAKDAVKDIFERTKTLLAPTATAQERDQLRQQLAGNLVFTGEEIERLDAANPLSEYGGEHYTGQQLKQLLDPEARKNFPKAVREEAERILGGKDKDVQAASRIALLYLSRNADGMVNDNIADAHINIPGSAQGEAAHRTAHAVTVPITASDVVNGMKRSVADTATGARAITEGDCLVRLGAMTHQQYAGTLQDVLSNPASSKADKMRALTDARGARLATIIDGLRYQESLPQGDKDPVERERSKGRAFGLTSADLLKTLETTAKNEKDADVKAMAAAVLYGLRERDVQRRTALLDGFNDAWQRLGDKDGAFADRVKTFLKKDMEAHIPQDAARAERVREVKLNAALVLGTMLADGDKAGQIEVTRALADLMGTTRADIAGKVVDALVPDRLAELTKADPRLANDVRAKALDLVKLPENNAGEAALVKLLGKMEPLMKDGDPELKQQLASHLQDFLRKGQYNRNYADGFPALRVAAIEGLSQLGAQGALDVIRAHVTAQPKLKVGNKEIESGEDNAAVRAAAVKALEHLKDPMLRQVVNELIEKETDANTASRLRDVRFASERLEPSSAAYKRKLDDALKDVIGDLSKYKYLDNFSETQQLQWIRNNFPVLDVDVFKQRCNDAAMNATSWVGRFFRSSSGTENYEWDAINPIIRERDQKWKELCDTAKGSDENANYAKLALHYIMTHNADPLGADAGNTIQVDGHELHQRLYNQDWREQAARALADCARTGSGSRDVTAYCIRSGFNSGQLGANVSKQLLEGWHRLGVAGPDGYAIPREKLANVTAEALRTELRRQRSSQNEEYQSLLLKDLKDYKHRMVFPVLDAMGQYSQFERIRNQAKETLADFQYSVNMMWDETPADSVSTAQARADRLKNALGDGNDAETTVQQLFGAYKGYRLTAGDPGLAFLQLAMNDNNERTQLAAAKVVAESSLPADHPAKLKARQTLTRLVATGSQPRYRTEAADEQKLLNR